VTSTEKIETLLKISQAELDEMKKSIEKLSEISKRFQEILKIFERPIEKNRRPNVVKTGAAWLNKEYALEG